MCNNVLPDFLPNILNFDGLSWEQVLDLLYEVFTYDFKNNNPIHCGLRVFYDRRILEDGDGKEEGFWHVISKKDRNTGERLPDYRRAERLPWARSMLENENRPELKVFDYDHGTKDKGVRRYVWLEDYDYVLILQKKKNIFFWITGYYVATKYGKRDLSKRYSKRKV